MSVPSSSLRLTMLFLPSSCFLLIDFRPVLFSRLVVAFPHCMIGFLLPSSVLWPCRSPHIQCFVHLSHLFSSVFFSLSTAWSLQYTLYMRSYNCSSSDSVIYHIPPRGRSILKTALKYFTWGSYQVYSTSQPNKLTTTFVMTKRSYH